MIRIIRLLARNLRLDGVLVQRPEPFLITIPISSVRPLDTALPCRTWHTRRIECLCRQHLRRRCGQVHGLDGRTVEFIQVQARHVVERVCQDLVRLHQLGLFVADVNCVVVGAGGGGELAAVDADGSQDKTAVAWE